MEAEEIKQEIRANATIANKQFGDCAERIQDDLCFVGGEQYLKADREIRGDGRAEIVVNTARQYCNQIINPYRSAPFGVGVSSTMGPESARKAEAMSRFVRGIEVKSNAKKAYNLAIDRQVKAGLGYIGVTTDYVSDESFDQDIQIIGFTDPNMIIYDPYSKEVDGSDANWCILVEHISDNVAKSKYGYDPETRHGLRYESTLVDTRWKANEGCVEVLHYFKLVKSETKIYRDEQGQVVKEARKNTKMKSRTVKKTVVECYRFIGDTQIGEVTTLPISRLPIIPVRGEMIDKRDGKKDWVGLVYFIKDPAKMVNWTASLSMEKIAIAPKATTYVDFKSIADFKDVWDQSNQLNPPYLPYSSTDAEGKVQYAPPQDRKTSADISDVSQAQANYQQLMSEVAGINPAGSNAGVLPNKSATEVLTQSFSAELSNFQFADNLAISMQALGRVLIELAPKIYDTPRQLPMVDEKGQTVVEEINIAEIDPKVEEFTFDVSASPMLASRKRESSAKLTALASILGDGAVLIASDIVRNTEMENAEQIAEKIDKWAMVKLGMGGNEQDPQAVEALTMAQNTIEQLKTASEAKQAELFNYIQLLQGEIQKLKSDNSAKILTTQMTNENRLQIEAMKNEASLTETSMKILADAKSNTEKAEVELAKVQTQKPETVVIQGYEPPMQSVSGMRTDLL